MRFSIITPTILRDSLTGCIDSVQSQTFRDFQHVIAIDGDGTCATVQDLYPQTFVFACGKRHNDFGNTARSMAWERATGEYLLFLDDDNAIASPHALADIAAALEVTDAPVAFFPILREGQRFFPLYPPAIGTVDTANLVVRRGIGRWPVGPEYEMDGLFIERLAREHKCAYFPDVEPIVIMERSNHGR